MTQCLDDFSDVSGWRPVTSGHAELRLSRDHGPRGASMRLDFDFKGGGGFVVARKEFSLVLPDAYAFLFNVRGRAPANKFEFKLADPTGRNVWRYQEEAFEFPQQWQAVRIRSRNIEFAWGPAGGGRAREVGAIEFVIAAGPGGQGTVWVDDLRIEDCSYRSVPNVEASGSAPGHEPTCLLDPRPETSWQSAAGRGPHWLQVDFGEEREYGGLVIHWVPALRAEALRVRAAKDTVEWQTAYSTSCLGGARTYVYLPDSTSRYLRLEMEAAGERGVGIASIDIRPYEFSSSVDDFFHAVAAMEARGLYPRYLCREQTYWSPVGTVSGSPCALLNEDGMVEVDEGSFSIEPFLYLDGRLVTWADVASTQFLEEGYLPIPSAAWNYDDLALYVTACATNDARNGGLYIRYRLENGRAQGRAVRLLAVLRPFQVTPPWQRFRDFGGVSPIREVSCGPEAVWVNRSKVVVPVDPPTETGAAVFSESMTERLALGEVPLRAAVADPSGWASAALRYDLVLPAAGATDVYVSVPFGQQAPDWEPDQKSLNLVPVAEQFASAAREWRATLGKMDIRLPARFRAAVDTLKTAAAHILIHRDGPALQPGPRRYTRSWIRDGAIMGAALLRVGLPQAMRDFIRWYARYQREDGFVPCCVDRTGPDWLIEHDSHGQLVYAVAEYFRVTGDRDFLSEMWPVTARAVECIKTLRSTHLSPEYRGPENQACFGLLPESASHEGYLAHPVHSYWDDFWALRGLTDAALAAEVLGHGEQAGSIVALRDELADALYASIRRTMEERHLNYIPGSVEWADFDPTATACAISLLDAAPNLPAAALQYTFDEYLEGFRKRRRGEADSAGYSPYEIRIIGALVRLGRRAEAHELLDFFLDDRRPRAWNQWPEIAWSDPRSPGHLGDLPHAWIGAEYILALMSMFAYERERDQALVVGAGVRPEWVEEEGLEVNGLLTWHGCLNLIMQRTQGNVLRVFLHGAVTMPPGKIVLHLPVDKPLGEVTVNGKPAMPAAGRDTVIDELPAEVVARC